MQKVQSQIKTTNYLMNTSLSFSGMAALNFLKDEFIIIVLAESIQTPYNKNQKSSGIKEGIKTKKLEYALYSSFSKLPHQVSNLDSSDPESDVLPITP